MDFTTVKERLNSDKWVLRSLPSMSASDYYLLHCDGKYYSFIYRKQNESVKEIKPYQLVIYNPKEFDELLKSTTKNHPYREELFQKFEDLSDCLKKVRQFIEKTENIFTELQKNNKYSFTILESWTIRANKFFDWLVLCMPNYITTFDNNRILSEIFNSLYLNPEHSLIIADETTLNKQDEILNKAALFFNSETPSFDGIIITDKKEDNNFGFFKNRNNEYVETNLVKDKNGKFEMKLYKKIPQSVYQEYILNKIINSNSKAIEKLSIDSDLREQIENLENFQKVQQGIKNGNLQYQGGQYRLNNLMVLNENELISPVTGDKTPLLQGIEDCFEMRNWYYEIIVEEVEKNKGPKILRNGNELKYIIPLIYSGKFSSEKKVGYTLVEVWKLLSNKNAEVVCESEIIYGEHETKRIERYGNILSMEETAIESGMGIHGGNSYWTFKDIPSEIKISASSKIDVRTGGHLSISVYADDAVITKITALLENLLP